MIEDTGKPFGVVHVSAQWQRFLASQNPISRGFLAGLKP
jgi:hypothetical protein